MAEISLDAAQQRVLGALMEKQRAVPASYPLSLNGLRTACNQLNSREPVTDYSESDVDATLRALKDAGLVRFVWAGKGSRVVKYHQLLDEVLGLGLDQAALVAVLLLRGAQTPGELKTRSERLHPFADRDAVDACLQGLAARGLVRQLPLARGHQDHRWLHLLGPVEITGSDAPPAGPDLESVLTGGAEARDAAVRGAYDAVAAAYREAYADELEGKLFDLWLLDRVADLAAGRPVADVACGPGHTTAYLADQGADVVGFDFSDGMLGQARTLFEDTAFEHADLRDLPKPRLASGWGAITCWYGLVHLAPSELAPTLAHLAATLVPGGWLVLADHLGGEVRHLESLLGSDVAIDFVLHPPGQLAQAAASAGLEVLEHYTRSPLPDETPTERCYLIARRTP